PTKNACLSQKTLDLRSRSANRRSNQLDCDEAINPFDGERNNAHSSPAKLTNNPAARHWLRLHGGQFDAVRAHVIARSKDQSPRRIIVQLRTTAVAATQLPGLRLTEHFGRCNCSHICSRVFNRGLIIQPYAV